MSLLHVALLFPLLLVLCPELLLPCGQRQGKHYLRLRQSRSLALWQSSLLPQVMSPSSSTTSTTRRLLKSSSRRNRATRSPRTFVTGNSTMRPSAERSLHHCSFRSEKNQRAEDKPITLMKKVCCQLSHFSHTQEPGNPCTNLVRQVQAAEKNQVATQKVSKSGFSLNDKKEQILADCRAEIQKHEFQADYGRRSIQKLNGIIESQRSEINHALQLRRDQLLLHEQSSEQNRDLREADMKSLNEMEELKAISRVKIR